jgi:hypothetical protein
VFAAIARRHSNVRPSPRATSVTCAVICATRDPNLRSSDASSGAPADGAPGSSWNGRNTTSTSSAPANDASARSKRRFPM